MKLKRIIASVLSLILLVSIFPMTAKANVQLPIEELKVIEVKAKKGYHPVTGQPLISPQVKIGWKDPGTWDPGSGTGQNAVSHKPERYLIEIRNMTKGTIERTINYPYDDSNPIKEVDLHNYFSFDSGSLYEIRVIPEHSHISMAGDDIPIRPPYNEAIYVLTDLDVGLETTENSIKVDWSNVNTSNVSYKITYAQVDYNDGDDRSKFEGSSKKYEIIVTSDMVEKDTSKNRLFYTISDNVEPGKPYAVTVEPIVDLQGKTVAYNNSPNIFTCHTTIYLNVIDEGDYIRFEWDISDSFKLNDGDYKLINTTIYEYVDGAVEGRAIVEFPGVNGANIKSYKIEKKEGVTLEYQLVLEYEGYPDLVKSDKVLFVPNQVILKPTKPNVPEPINDDIIEQLIQFFQGDNIQGELGDILSYHIKPVGEGGLGLSRKVAVERLLKERYLVEQDSYYAESLSQLLGENRTFHVVDELEAFNFVWSAFRYKDTNASSPTYGEIKTDYNVYYDIWVSNDMNQLSMGTKIESDLRIDSALDEDKLITNEFGEVVGFSHILDSYYDPELGIRDIAPGQVYYIQIVAKKKYGNQVVMSDPEILSVYYSYDGDAYVPPTMSTPPLKVIKVEEDNATLQWREEWFEVISTTGSIVKWSHEVWAEKNGAIYTEAGEGRQHFVLEDKNDVMSLRNFIGNANFDSNYAYRKIDLGKDPYGVSDVKYDLLKLNYKEIEKELKIIRETDPDYTLDEYIKNLLDKGQQGKIDLDWKAINPTKEGANGQLITHNEPGLQPNEIYLFLIRPYREMANGDVLVNYYPASVIVATPDDGGGLEPTPTVPYLEVKSGYSDTEVTLIWDYYDAFEYEILYSTYEDRDEAKTLEWSILDDYEEGNVPRFIEDYKLVVDNLFPDTTYFFWIKAKSKANGAESKWSSAVIGTTADLEAPLPPRGVGMGSKSSLRKFDVDEPLGKDYITIEWILDSNDEYRRPDKDDIMDELNKEYSYILEVADNPVFLDAIRVEITNENMGSTVDNVEIFDKNLVKVKDLIANRMYYVRMKTKVTVTSSDSDKSIVKESKEYSPTIFLITQETDDEYDGNIDPDDEKLPDEDYEITYDKDKNLLEFRFRGYEEEDNNVDQRLIAELMEENLSSYEVDVRRYKNEPIDTWVIRIPDTIMQAFQEQQVELVIDADKVVLEFPHNAFRSAVAVNAYEYGNRPEYKIVIDKVPSNKQKYNQPDDVDSSLSDTFQVSAILANDLREEELLNMEALVTVKLRPNTRYEYIDKEVDAYAYNPNTKDWSRTKAQLEMEKGLVSFKTGRLGSYGIFVSENPIKNLAHWSETYRKSVLKHFNIKGYEEKYDPDNKVLKSQMMNLSIGLINGLHDLDMNGKLKKAEINALVAAKLLSSQDDMNGYITRKEAVEVFIKTYELRDGQTIFVPPSKKTEELSFKAYSVGIISQPKLDRPNDSLTYGELFYMLTAFIE